MCVRLVEITNPYTKGTACCASVQSPPPNCSADVVPFVLHLSPLTEPS